jgi:FkbM family methyltransferase
MIARLWQALSGSRAGRHYLRRLGGTEGFQEVFNVLANRVAWGLHAVAGLGLAPDVIVDIGADSGGWTQMALSAFPAARIVMIEARPECEPQLARVRAAAPARVGYELALLGDHCAPEIPFFVAGTGSSLYVENTSFPQRRITLPMTTLDAVMAKHAPSGEVFLKLDVQGAELDIIKGAPRTLERTSLILLEASLVEYNQGAPRLAETVAFMRERDYLLFDIWDLRRIGPVLAQVDLVFARRGSALESRAAAIIGAYGAAAAAAPRRSPAGVARSQ